MVSRTLENGGFDLPLRKDANEIAVAIDGNTPDMRGRDGWDFIMRMDKAAHSSSSTGIGAELGKSFRRR